MSNPPLEPELEAFLSRVVPGLAEQWQGCALDEISRIEALAGRPLPPFYRWFLARMGRDMGPLAYADLDFSARRVINSYAEGVVALDAQFLLIGYSADEVMPLHFFYDLELQVRDDARVTSRHADDDERYDQFETLREMLAHRALLSFVIDAMPQRCRVLLKGNDPDLFAQLDSVLEKLGFTRPIPTGACCGLYEGRDAAIACSKTPRDDPQSFMFVTLGGRDSGTLRRVLGTIATESSLAVEVREWAPALG